MRSLRLHTTGQAVLYRYDFPIIENTIRILKYGENMKKTPSDFLVAFFTGLVFALLCAAVSALVILLG